MLERVCPFDTSGTILSSERARRTKNLYHCKKIVLKNPMLKDKKLVTDLLSMSARGF